MDDEGMIYGPREQAYDKARKDRRDRLAAFALAGMLMRDDADASAARDAVYWADALIAELDKK